MDRRWIAFFAIILLAFSLSGCTEKTTTGGVRDPFIGGTTGLVVDFVEGAPQSEVYDGGDFEFEVTLMIENEGESEVKKENAVVRVKGIRPEEFSVTSSDLTQNPEDDILPKRKDPEGSIIESDPIYVTFEGLNHKEKLTGNTPFTLLAEVCYDYTTKANVMLCVRDDLLDTTNEGICTVSEIKGVANSGAPVHVENFRESARSKTKVGFSFEVQHRGTGDVYMKEVECDPTSMKYEDEVWVDVKTEISGTSCSGLSDGDDTSGYVKIHSGKAVVTCTQEISEPRDYESPVVIELTYGYQEEKTTEIVVKHTLDDE